ncbi:peptidoglycan-binding protein [Maritimibacter sp. HL-12]|uniref:glycoside hydrolase family protein n=1 Tax=Maritimibacter sp. HL-12 TaxID=1162418 RepID=UPI000A0EFDF5|nr:peptidoglycan-binding protein [Maritimibacter sp. HL-12]SMH35955.1 lysozyme [Maritimibacter sp. HL-12]
MATTSSKGIAVLKQEEGEVLKAYRCPAGKMTIGVGLTAASGVIDPKPGMVITAGQSSDLLRQALRRNYEPAVAKAMPSAKAHEFDGGVLFHFNTGAIGRASWVKAWRTRDWDRVSAKIVLWNKGGGKVLPGLTRRRAREFKIMRYGDYGLLGEVPKASSADSDVAKWALPVDRDEIARIRAAFAKLGYAPGNDGGGVHRDAVTRFQREHDLNVDGIIGRATLSTLQRRLDATRKAATATTGAATGAAGTEGADAAGLAVPDWALWVVAGLVALIALRLAWSYRDVIAAKVQNIAPGLARTLRRF